MNSTVTTETVSFAADTRGWVIEPVPEAILADQRNVHIVLTEPGGIRGNHLHQRSTEVLTVMGPALARFREAGGLRDISVPEGQAFRFTIPPGVAHAVQNTGTRPMILMSFSTQPYDRTNPDTVPDVLIAK